MTNPGPSGPSDDSGLLDLKTPPPPAVAVWHKDPGEPTLAGGDLEGIAESTMITGAPGGFGGFMMDNAAEEGGDATVISSGPPTAK